MFAGLFGWLAERFLKSGSADAAATIGAYVTLLVVPIAIGAAAGTLVAFLSASVTLLEGLAWFGGLNTGLAILTCVLFSRGLVPIEAPYEEGDVVVEETSLKPRRR